jgi:hypothetical protein
MATTFITHFNGYKLLQLLQLQRLFYLRQYKAKPIDLYFVSRGKQHTKLAGREAPGLQPLQVINRQVAYKSAFIFAKGHFGLDQLDKNF